MAHSESKEGEFAVYRVGKSHFTHDNKAITLPDGWIVVEAGDAALTRRVKCAGTTGRSTSQRTRHRTAIARLRQTTRRGSGLPRTKTSAIRSRLRTNASGMAQFRPALPCHCPKARQTRHVVCDCRGQWHGRAHPTHIDRRTRPSGRHRMDAPLYDELRRDVYRTRQRSAAHGAATTRSTIDCTAQSIPPRCRYRFGSMPSSPCPRRETRRHRLRRRRRIGRRLTIVCDGLNDDKRNHTR